MVYIDQPSAAKYHADLEKFVQGLIAQMRLVRIFVCGCLAVPLAAFQSSNANILAKLGHSQHGESFDTGPREKPWPIEGIGVAHFPITTKNPGSAALVRPGQRPAPFLLGLRSRARLSLVPEAGARQRHGVLGAGARGHAARLGRTRPARI